MPEHDADAERQHDDDEVLRAQPEGLLGERRAEHAEHADERCRDREIDQRPADLPVVADEREPLAELDDDGAHRVLGLADAAARRLPVPVPRRPVAPPAGSSRTPRRRSTGRRRPAISAGAPAIFTISGPRRANPIANAAFSVSVKIPFADISWRFGTSIGIIAASAGAKNTVIVETVMFSR